MKTIRCFFTRLKNRFFPSDAQPRAEYEHEHNRLEDDGCGSHPFHEAHPPIEPPFRKRQVEVFDETGEEEMAAILLAEEDEL